MEDQRPTAQALDNVHDDSTLPAQRNSGNLYRPMGLQNSISTEKVPPSDPESPANHTSSHSRPTDQKLPAEVSTQSIAENSPCRRYEVNISDVLPPKCRTFRLSEVPIQITRDVLSQFLDDHLSIRDKYVKGNSRVFSLVPYGSWQVATVSFHEEPDDIQNCKPDKLCYLRLTKTRTAGHTVSIMVTADCDFYSMTPLYQCPAMPRYDVIALTGLSAHAFGSWKSPDRSDVMWLRDILPIDCPDSRILTWGYHSSLEDAASSTSIADISRKFLLDINIARNQVEHRPLILVGHSLGGLILQKALVEASKRNNAKEEAFLRSCVGILLFGVPHQGLNRHSIQSLVKGRANEQFLGDLSTGSEFLFTLRSDFRNCFATMSCCEIVSIYETEDTNAVEKNPAGISVRSGQNIRMVPRESAISPMSADCDQISIRADHSKLVKFRSRTDEHYQRVRIRIQELGGYHILGDKLIDDSVSGDILLPRYKIELRDLPFAKILKSLRDTWIEDPQDATSSTTNWVTKDIAFNTWCSADTSQILWVTGGPEDGHPSVHELTRMLSVAKSPSTTPHVLYMPIIDIRSSNMPIDLDIDSSPADNGPFKSPVPSNIYYVLYHMLSKMPINQARQAVRVLFDYLMRCFVSNQKKDSINRHKSQWPQILPESIRDFPQLVYDLEANTNALNEILDMDRTKTIVLYIIIPYSNIVDMSHIQNDLEKFLSSFTNRHVPRPSTVKIMIAGPDLDLLAKPFITKCQKLQKNLVKYDTERRLLLDALRFDNRRYGNISTQDSRTLEWIWADIQYTKWRDSEKSCLFHVQGKPGSGKSTFMKYFGNNLIKQPHVPRNAVVSSFFYSDRIEGDGQTSHYSMLRKILYDILEQNESFFYHFQSEFRRHQLDSCFSYESLQSILRSIGRNHDQRETIFLLIDAVDESSHEDRQHILQLLIDVCSENGFCTVKIVFASRPVPILDSLVRNASSFLRMQDVNTSDIEGYVSAFLIQLDFSENLLQKARNYILKQAHGVFLWVCLVKDRLIKCAMEGARNHEIISTLEGLPTELEGMYKLMLGNLSSDQRHTIDRTRIFELVLFAARPLRISEMNHALATADVLDHTSTEEISWETFENSLSAGIKAKIIGCGGNLLELKGPTEEDPMVQLMHQTVRDFMLGDNGPARSLNIHLGPESNANHRIVVLCLRYLIVCIGNLSKLQHPSFNHWSGETFISFVKFLNERCFLSYIFSHLGDHMKASSVKTPEITALMGDFRDLISKDRTTQSLLGGWLSANFIGLFPEQDFNEDILSNFKSSLLCCAAMNNLIVATRTLLTLGARPHKVKYFDSKCQTDQNPAPLIILAIAMHFNDVVLLLLEYMPDLINLFWDGHRSLLHHAIEHANETIMNFLLDSGHVSIDSTNGIDYTACSALLYACHNPNQPGPIKLLLDRGADRDMSSGGYISPLSYSSLHGHENVVRLLLDHGADVNLSYNFFGVPLHYAAKNGQENIVKILMHHGANINSKSADGGPLHYASFHGHERTVRTLLDYGADINMCSEFDGSPLHCAVSAGWESIVRLLLQRGADVNIKTTLLGTPLAVALGTKVIRSSVIVDTLLSYGAVFAEC